MLSVIDTVPTAPKRERTRCRIETGSPLEAEANRRRTERRCRCGKWFQKTARNRFCSPECRAKAKGAKVPIMGVLGVLQEASILPAPDLAALLGRMPIAEVRRCWRALVMDHLIDAGYIPGSLAYVGAILTAVEARYEGQIADLDTALSLLRAPA